MGIKNVRVLEITSTEANVYWDTDEASTTGMMLGVRQPDGTYAKTELTPTADAPSTTHKYPLSDTELDPGMAYSAEPRSFYGPTGRYLTCSDQTSPSYFTTPPVDGEVSSVSASSDAQEIAVGGSATITIKASYDSGSAAGEKVMLSIINGKPGGEERGTFDPAEPVTDSAGTARTKFTAACKGAVHIQITADNMTYVLKLNVK